MPRSLPYLNEGLQEFDGSTSKAQEIPTRSSLDLRVLSGKSPCQRNDLSFTLRQRIGRINHLRAAPHRVVVVRHDVPSLDLECVVPLGDLDIPHSVSLPTLQGVPAGMPSTLLQRFPDIAAAEGTMLHAANLVWSIGSTGTETLFQQSQKQTSDCSHSDNCSWS
jgi:hypothetical protein